MRTERNKNGSFRGLIVVLVLLLAEALWAYSSTRRSPPSEFSLENKLPSREWTEQAAHKQKPGK